MADATLTSKGQITIPADIRRELGLGPQDLVSFTLMPDGTVVLRAKNKSLLGARGMLKPRAGGKVSVEDMNLGRA